MVVFTGNFIGSPSATIFRRNKLKFNERLKWLVDIDFYIRMLQEDRNCAFAREELVSVTVGSREQVTAECLNNKNVEMAEYLFIYQRITKESGADYRRFIYMWDVLERFQIGSGKDIRACGWRQPLGIDVASMIFFRRIRSFVSRYILRPMACSAAAVLRLMFRR